MKEDLINPIYVLLGAIFIALLAIVIGALLQNGYEKYKTLRLASRKRKSYEMVILKSLSPVVDITNQLWKL